MKLDSLVPHLYTNMSIDSVGMFVALNWAQRQNGMELMSIGVEITSARRWVFTHILCHLALAPSTNFRRLLHIDWEFLQKVICTNWPNWQVLSAYLFISPLLLKGGTTNRVNEGSAGRSEESRRNCVLLLGKVLRRSRSRAALTSSSSSGISTQPKVSREREKEVLRRGKVSSAKSASSKRERGTRAGVPKITTRSSSRRPHPSPTSLLCFTRRSSPSRPYLLTYLLSTAAVKNDGRIVKNCWATTKASAC